MSTAPQDCSVGFDLGGTKMFAVVYDPLFQPLGRKRMKTSGTDGKSASLERVAKAIEKACEEAGVTPAQIRSIGVGCPGPLDLDEGVVLSAPNLGWNDVRVKEYLEKHFGCPAAILNDVDAGVYGEYCFGAAREARCALGIFPGTGIGGGCVYEGKILRGRRSSAMEVGHIQAVPEGPRCGCGRYGCLEAVASRLAIAAAAAQAAYRGQAPYLMQKAGTDLAKIRSGTLAAAIENGDAVVEEIVRQAARHIGYAIAGLAGLISPDVVVLGGGLIEAMPNLIVEEVKRAVGERVMPSFANTFQIRPAQLGDDATALGAAAWARNLLEEAPAWGELTYIG